MGYVSKLYLQEKWIPLKHDMELCIKVFDLEGGDKVSDQDVKRCKSTIINMCEAIISEMNKS